MFKIQTIHENGFEKLRLADNTGDCYAEIIPACGAILNNFSVRRGNSWLNVIDSYKDKIEFEEECEAKGFKSNKLSPFVCRLNESSYLLENKRYTVEKFLLDGAAIHGLIYNEPFTVIDRSNDETSASVTLLHSYKGSDPGYPFSYDCEIAYTLEKGHILNLFTKITNQSDLTIPVTDGWHPYFNMGGKIDDLLLEFQSMDILEFDDSLIPTGKKIRYEEFGSLKKIGDTFLDNCFTLDLTECQPLCVLRNPVINIQLEIHPDSSYPYLQIYTPPHRHSIAIENLSGAPDAFNNGMGLILLKPGEKTSFRTRYKIADY